MATLSDLLREIGELSNRSNRVMSDLRGWLNRGQRAIAQRRNWTWMHSQQRVTILAGATSVDLPVLFKELAAEKSPITYTDPLNAQFPHPVHVRSRAELEAMAPGYEAYVTNAPAGYGTPYYVFLEQNDGGRWTLNIPQAYPVLTSIAYNLSCYLFPQDLSAGGDHSPITDDGELCEALINWTRAKAWGAEDPTDPKAMAAQGLYEQSIQRALGQDSRKKIAGRRMRM